MPTKPDTIGHDLSVEQHNAVDLLVLGTTDADTAEAVGVTRQTVNLWRNHHPAFIADLNARRLDVWGGACDRLRALLPQALDALEAAVTADPPDWRAAAKVVELAGLDRQERNAPNLGPRAIGPTDPDAVVGALARARRPGLTEMFDPVTPAERRAALRALVEATGE